MKRMKKLVFAVLAIAVCSAAHAQVDKNAIGLRIGGGNLAGAEFSYQLGFNNVNRLELDLGFGGNNHYNAIGLCGIYHWVWNIGTEGFNWYVGPGAGLSLFSGKNDIPNYTGVSIGGQIGLGFNFRIPLQLTIDTRPMWDLTAGDGADTFGWGLALGVRYRF